MAQLYPNARTAANVAELLAEMGPGAASDGLAKILAAIRAGLERDGETPEAVEEFVAGFASAVVQQLQGMVRGGAALH